MVFHERDKVRMALDPEVDQSYPVRWIGKVTVETVDGRTLSGRVDEPKGDPGNMLARAELEDKALRLAAWSGAATKSEMQSVIGTVWKFADVERVNGLLA